MPVDFVPSREAELVPFTNNFSTELTSTPTLVGCTAAQATAFAALNAAWTASYAIAVAPSTRTSDTIQTKNAAKLACVASLRELARIIQSFPGTTDALRAQFGLTIADPRSPIPVPTEIPVVEVKDRYGTTVILRLHDGTAEKAKPARVQGARVYSFIGAVPPTDPQLWTLEGQVTRTEVEIEFPITTLAGTTVWFTAAWYNPRGEVGPGCNPISTVLAGAAMNLAA